MKKAIIFDLDQTLIDSRNIEHLRSRRDWKAVLNNINQCVLYNGLDEVFNYIRQNNIKVAIVSTAPSMYVKAAVDHFNIPCSCIVGYHDVPRGKIKPQPDQMYKALELLQEDASDVISFGDRAIDIIASNKADIESVACYWGTMEENLLRGELPSFTLESSSEIINFIKQWTYLN